MYWQRRVTVHNQGVAEDGSREDAPFPPTTTALDEKDRRGRRLYLVQTCFGALLLVIGVYGGLHGSVPEWGVAACGAGIVGIGIWMLLRYRRIAADQRSVNSSSEEG